MSQLFEISEELTDMELHQLEKHEAVIESGLQTFYSVGTALLAIRDSRLYRAEFRTFEDYCRERWQMGRRNAYQLIEAAQVFENVRDRAQIMPENERQVRPMAQLEPEEQKLVWKKGR
jgi:hypothetical protein